MRTRRAEQKAHAAGRNDGTEPAELDREAIEGLYARLAAANPEPHSELDFADPYTLLVAVVLSAQATDAGVNRATATLFGEAPTPQAMVDLGEERLRERIKTIGLFNTKARNVIALSRILVEQYGGAVPHDREALERLPGVGRKSANVVLNVAFGEPTIAVDTHVFRVGNRTGLARGATPAAVERALLERTPAGYMRHAHHWLILHGRHICQARRPRCPDCVVREFCLFEPKTPAPLPVAAVQPAAR